jgi:hypothetical protein
VSLARTPGATIVALTDAGPVGVDVTTARDGPVSGARRLRRVPAQFDPGATNRAITGVRTESLLKALGTGLTIDPGLIELSAPTEPAVITDWQVPDLPVPQAKIYDLITTDHHHAARDRPHPGASAAGRPPRHAAGARRAHVHRDVNLPPPAGRSSTTTGAAWPRRTAR